MNQRNMALAAAAFTAAVGLLFAGTPAQAAEKIKMSMAAASSPYAPYFAAIEKGYFAEEGLEVELIKAGGGVATPALMSGSLDVSTSGSSAMSAIIKGADIQLVFFPWDRPTYQLRTTTKDIKTLEDLKGKSVGILTRGDTFEIATRMMFMKRGLDPNMISFTPLGYGNGRFAAITSGSLPAVVVSRRDVEFLRPTGALEKGNMLVDMYEEIRMPWTGLAVSGKMVRDNRDKVKKIVRASRKGMIYAVTFRDETINLTVKHVPNATYDLIKDAHDDTIDSKTEDGTVPLDIQKLELRVRADVVKLAEDKIPAPEKVFDMSIIREVNAELAASGWKPTR